MPETVVNERIGRQRVGNASDQGLSDGNACRSLPLALPLPLLPRTLLPPPAVPPAAELPLPAPRWCSRAWLPSPSDSLPLLPSLPLRRPLPLPEASCRKSFFRGLVTSASGAATSVSRAVVHVRRPTSTASGRARLAGGSVGGAVGRKQHACPQPAHAFPRPAGVLLDLPRHLTVGSLCAGQRRSHAHGPVACAGQACAAQRRPPVRLPVVCCTVSDTTAFTSVITSVTSNMTLRFCHERAPREQAVHWQPRHGVPARRGNSALEQRRQQW